MEYADVWDKKDFDKLPKLSLAELDSPRQSESGSTHLEPIFEEAQVPNASKLASLKKENDDLKELINK